MTSDWELLRQYREERSESGFGELVNRHIDLVYAAALRVVGGDGHLAQDITQIVFMDLARKAWSLPRGVVLAGWLYRHACFTASKAVRAEQRRRMREQIATEMSTTHDSTGPDWEQLAPHLDAGLNQLNAADRDAIVLRFFKQQDLRAVGVMLGVGEDAAQKRVSRALEKLRVVLNRRGVSLTAVGLASLLATQTLAAAPAGLALSVTTASLTAGATAGTGLSLLLMKVMAMTKLQMTVVGVVLLAAVATPVAVLQQQSLGRTRVEVRQLRQENELLQTQAAGVATLIAENQRLSNLVAQSSALARWDMEPSSELLRLRNQVTRLHAEAQAHGKSSAAIKDLLTGPQMTEYAKGMAAMSVNSAFGKFFTDAQLPPDQTRALRDLLIDREVTGLEASMEAWSGNADARKVQEQMEQTRAKKAAINDQIKALLGPDGMAQFEEYGRSQPHRTMVSRFEEQLSPDAALSPAQERRLVDALKQEVNNFKFTVNFSDEAILKENPAVIFSEERVRLRIQEQERLDQNCLASAKDILSPDQLEALARYLGYQRQAVGFSLAVQARVLGGK